jgi:hypothetical protein
MIHQTLQQAYTGKRDKPGNSFVLRGFKCQA